MTEEHTKKTWLEEEIEKTVLVKREDIIAVAEAICEKILEEVDKKYTEGELHHCFSLYELKEIIKELGVEI